MASCIDESSSKSEQVFQSSIELDFINEITADSLNVYEYHYLYNGGGVGIADFNMDGIKDIFFGGNMVSSKLLVGQGDLSYRDETTEAGLTTTVWVNGISVIDINHDDRPDIYLSIGGPSCRLEPCHNLLFINNSTVDSILFTEESASYGLDISDYSQQGLFIDLDLDGDLDLFQLQNYVDPKTKNYPKPKRYFSDKSIDKILINQEVETGIISFSDQSEKWGITHPGFGLGVAMTDVNDDGYPDIYVANDFITDDIFYINQGGEKMVDRSKAYLKHTSYNSMGVDIADINNDELEDILVVDMLPYDNARQKTMLGGSNYDKYLLSKTENYNDQYIKNTLQLHSGTDPYKNLAPFCEVASMIDIEDTDWSWSPLLADFDNDGFTDIFISNGYGKNITDLDFVNYASNPSAFSSPEKVKAKIKAEIDKLEPVKLPNYLFINATNETFSPTPLRQSTITNGAAYGDLDNDGDLDLVLNNIDDPAQILINNSTNNYLKVNLKGSVLNTAAIGSKVKLTLSNGKTLSKTLSPTRSYLSCMDSEFVFGLGELRVKKIDVKWPSGELTEIDSVLHNSKIDIDYHKVDKAAVRDDKTTVNAQKQNRLVQKSIHPVSIDKVIKHEYNIQPLLIKPCLVAKPIMVQSKDAGITLLANHNQEISKLTEDGSVEALIALGDEVVTDLKLIEIEGQSNIIFTTTTQGADGKASSTLYNYLLSDNVANRRYAKGITPGVYKLDLIMIEGQESPSIITTYYPTAANYPNADQKSIQLFDLEGNLKNGGSLEQIVGNITDLKVKDVNGDQLEDLVLTGEWMAPSIWLQRENNFTQTATKNLNNYTGMWQCLELTDIDQDGDMDLFLGNLSSNTRHHSTADQPLQIVASDIDGNGSIDPLLSSYNRGSDLTYPYHTRDDINKIVPAIKASFTSYASFGKASYEEANKLSNKAPDILAASHLENMLLINDGNFNFSATILPLITQQSVINDVLVMDINNDGLNDILAATNLDGIELHNGNIDGLNGLVLLQTDSLKFDPLEQHSVMIPEPAYDLLRYKEGFMVATRDSLYYLHYQELEQQ